MINESVGAFWILRTLNESADEQSSQNKTGIYAADIFYFGARNWSRIYNYGKRFQRGWREIFVKLLFNYFFGKGNILCLWIIPNPLAP